MTASSQTSPPRPLNPRFQVRNDYLEAVNEELFARTPSTLLEIFVVLQQNPDVIIAVPQRPATTRPVRQPLHPVEYTKAQLYAMLAEAVRNTG